MYSGISPFVFREEFAVFILMSKTPVARFLVYNRKREEGIYFRYSKGCFINYLVIVNGFAFC